MRALLILLLTPSVAFGWTICIDPGHGRPSAPGTRCEDASYHEADLVWDVASGLFDALDAALPGSVYITRLRNGTLPTQEQRAQIGIGYREDAYGRLVGGIFSPHKADVFLSIHFDTYQASLSGTHIYVFGDGTRNSPDYSPDYDSCYAFSLELVNFHVMVTDQVWEDAGAWENGSHFPFTGWRYEPHDDGIMGVDDLTVLNYVGWLGAPEWHARCLIEGEFMRVPFCDMLWDSYDEYVEHAVEGIYWASLVYQGRADPGGGERIVHLPREIE